MVQGAYAQQVDPGHFLKVNSVPNILFIPGSGFYPTGTIVTLDEVPKKWNEYEFLYDIEEWNGKIKKITQKTSMRYFSVEELELLLDMAGLKIIELYGDFDSSPYEQNSPEEIYIAGLK